MAEQQPPLDWRAIFRVAGIVTGATALFGIAIPLIGALIGEAVGGTGPLNTRVISGHELYRWLYWAVSWGVMFWQGQWMLRRVGKQNINDMLVTAIITAVALMIVKFVVWIVYDPVNSGQRLFAITAIDAMGALALLIVGFIAARINAF